MAAKNKKTQVKNNKKPAVNRGMGKEIAGILMICLGVIFGISVFTTGQQWIVFWLRKVAMGCFGILGYAVPVVLVALGILVIALEKRQTAPLKIIIGILGILSIMAVVHTCYISQTDVEMPFSNFIEKSFRMGWSDVQGAGFFGVLLCWPLCQLLGIFGSIVLLFAIIVIAFMVVFEVSIKAIVKKAAADLHEKKQQIQNSRLWGAADEDAQDEPPFAVDVDEEERYEDVPYEDNGHIMPSLKQTEGTQAYLYRPEYEYTQPEPKKKRKKRRNNLLLDDAQILLYEQAREEERSHRQELNIIGKDLHGSFVDPQKKVSSRWPQLSEENSAMTNAWSPFNPTAGGYAHGEPLVSVVQEEEEPPFDVEEAYEEPLALAGEEELKKKKKEEKDRRASRKIEPVTEPPAPASGYQLPPVDLLNINTTLSSSKAGVNEVLKYSQLLESTLESFSVSAKVVNTERGPKVTRYELQPAPGVKISKIVGLSDDLALNLAAESVRIVAPIPGKAAIGIEIPNKESATVVIRDLIDCPEFHKQKGTLTFALGKDIMGKNVYADLAKMPHLLVAGTTGSGKSVCLNTIIASLLYRTTPDEVRFMMIDPKRGVEMAKYNGLPNLITPVVMEPAKAAGALTWAVNEMINRYKAFNQTGARNIERHNEILREREMTPLPKLVIVIDEFADLMMVSSKEVEDAVCRIAQLGRASGIHLVIATQSPRADIFTGLIKANVPSRIALTVGNALESRIIMDATGAEKLLGSGDMLFRPIGVNKPTRIQGCWISDAEIERLVSFLTQQAEAEYDEELDAQIEKLAEQSGKKESRQEGEQGGEFSDDLTTKAIQLAMDYDGISASMLQRRLRVGYARASRLVDELEALGIVGPADGSKPRQLLISYEEYMRLYGGDLEQQEEDFDD